MTEIAADYAVLAQRVDELAAMVSRLTNDVADLAAAFAPNLGAGAFGAPGHETGELPEPRYETVDEWVAEFFLPTFRRQFGGELRWCHQWQEHPEALLRLEALWRAWEALRHDPAFGMATWLTSYADPQLATLLHRGGTFASCTPSRHDASEPAP